MNPCVEDILIECDYDHDKAVTAAKQWGITENDIMQYYYFNLK